ncbi:glucose-6-phosphate isomerase [Candidatus Pelagibacter bacterium]|nr:glucose-6-phosphate isomerase [Candidatus Pelagibacter bacterium]
MKNKKIIYKNFIQKDHLNLKLNKNLQIKYNKLLSNINKYQDNENDVFHTLTRKFKINFQIKDLKKFKRYKRFVLIGMGGSILGSEAIYEFLKSKIRKNFHFFDNLDEEKLDIFRKSHKFNKTLFIVISKSGETLETLSNLVALKILKKNSKNLIVVTEKNNGYLHSLSKKMKFYFIEHRSYVSGRYSVLSEVGILPTYLMGLQISNLRKNLLVHLKNKKNKSFLKDSTIKLANIILRKKIKSLILFNYEPKLEKFLYWYQQLIAESLGKKGRGLLPIISPAPKDHHSLLQLYLDGPRDKLFYILSSSQDFKYKIFTKNLGEKFKYLNNLSLNQIKNAQKKAFMQSLKKKKIAFREFKIGHFNEQTIGELFSYFIIETAMIGKLININPFDQPAVEKVKKATKKELN